jgi:phosphoserine phosphatase
MKAALRRTAIARTAGLGVAYRAKPKTKAAADASLEHADLAALLWVMGYAEEGV